MLAEERKNKIIELVNTNKLIKVSELSHLLNATEVTIRKDLEELQAQKYLRRIHGGAISIAPANKIISERQLQTSCIQEKKAIARHAYQYIDNDDTLIFDRSTTVYELAKLILEKPFSNLTIITNSLRLTALLASKEEIRLIFIGGEINVSMNCTYGVLTNKLFRDIRSDKCFIGISGIDPSYGYSDPNLNDCGLKQEILKASKQKFVLADPTKFNESFIGKAANFTGVIDYLITDTLPHNIDRRLYENEVNFIVVDEIPDNST